MSDDGGINSIRWSKTLATEKHKETSSLAGLSQEFKSDTG
jgi:hypothetical protein